MLISVTWLRDFVDIPAETGPRDLANMLTMSTAEVEGVKEVTVQADGLIAAGVTRVGPVPDRKKLTHATLDVGGSEIETVTAAPSLQVGDVVVYAPEGTSIGGIGPIKRTTVGEIDSVGMILPGDAIGILQTTQDAVFLPPSTEPGTPVDLAELNDWVLEIDNKSITHRPDLWGHYGIAREVAALCGKPLRPYTDVAGSYDELIDETKPTIPIEIDDPTLCPRYSALTMTGLHVQPSPLWMQARLSHVGQRPIDLLVDLTNYVMFDIGQPTHAFDGDKVDRIEVAVARPGETFTTLDDMQRKLPEGTLMIQSGRRHVALAGIMGGADTEVTEQTETVLLESANFEPATIRRAAAAMGHRTEASARFEKALDPINTVLGIGRFIKLAAAELPGLGIASNLSDAYPAPPEPVDVEVDLAFASRFIGVDVARERAETILSALGFACTGGQNGKLRVRVPTWRATRDVGIEADVIEELSRIIGYDNIPADLPDVTMRSFQPVPDLLIERRSLEVLCQGLGFNEIHGYTWYDPSWNETLGFMPGECVEIAGASAGGRWLRHTVMPQLLAAADLNRRHDDRFELVTVGSVFFPEPDPEKDWPAREARRMGLAVVGRGDEDARLANLKSAVETWSRHVLHRQAAFNEPTDAPDKPWEHPIKTADITVAGQVLGRLTVVPVECRVKIDDHLRRWAIALAEIDLDAATAMGPADEALERIPIHQQVRLDFSILVPATRRYAEIADELGRFEHPLLRRLTYVESYEGKNIPDGTRSLTFRAQVGAHDRTLTDPDLQAFRQAFTEHLHRHGLELRS